MTDLTLNLYNPATQSAEQLLDEFIDRKDLLARILDIIRHNTADRPQQHVMLLGPRGMGKTTLLCAIKHSIERDEALNAEWLPVLFQEESYGIGDLADFWLESLRHLAAVLKQKPQAAERLLDANPDDLAEQAEAAFLDLLATSGKRALLLIDNINDIFADIDDGHALHKLRALWMTDPRLMVVGAAPSYFDEITHVDQAFHDFFRIFTLERLSQGELETFLRGFAERQGDAAVLQIIEQAPERIAALRILTGGNPRLVKLGYRILRDGLDGDARRDMERLLDECTPFFKHRIDSLAKEARRAFDAIARRWDPVSVDDIRRELRKPSNYVSAQIKRLIDEGFIEAAGGGKKKRYQVSERFYNVYYLMRYSREGRRRLRWLVGFMQTFYTKKDFKEWAKRLDKELSAPMADSLRADKLAHLHALCDAADDGGRAQAFEAIVRDAIARNDRTALDEAIAEGDPVETFGWRYLYAEVVWLLPSAIQKQIGFDPADSKFHKKLNDALTQQNLLLTAETHLYELGSFKQDSARAANASGVILEWMFLHDTQAEVAYRKALEIDPDLVHAWINLGNALGNQNRHGEAEAAYRHALKSDPDYAIAWNNLGISLNKQIRYVEAETACRKAVEIEPDFVNAWNWLGNALTNQDRYGEAEATYRKAIALDSNYHWAWSNLAGIYLLHLNRAEEGIDALVHGLGLSPDYDYALSVLKNFWQPALPEFARRIANNQTGADNLRTAMTNVLLDEAASSNRAEVKAALEALPEAGQQPFEPLLLALQALDDRNVLYRIAREKRDLVLDVMARISPDTPETG